MCENESNTGHDYSNGSQTGWILEVQDATSLRQKNKNKNISPVFDSFYH